MKAFQANLAKLEGADTQVLGVSIDSAFANHAFAEKEGISFPLLGDQSGKTIEDYGLTKPFTFKAKDAVSGQEVPVTMKTARRATFLIDKDGKIIEEQVDNEAVDPTKVVEACERRRLSQ
ncbi:MAG: redoxin domain-containing protein [Acidobacteria bacterium]|nr:redoxin domain-containing protein [Acidobacteriota bacterium]